MASTKYQSMLTHLSGKGLADRSKAWRWLSFEKTSWQCECPGVRIRSLVLELLEGAEKGQTEIGCTVWVSPRTMCRLAITKRNTFWPLHEDFYLRYGSNLCQIASAASHVVIFRFAVCKRTWSFKWIIMRLPHVARGLKLILAFLFFHWYSSLCLAG
jgi:hypothetical protein